jgi:hypothetical protein
MIDPATQGVLAKRRPLWRMVVAVVLLTTAVGMLAHSFAPRYVGGLFATAPNAMVLPRGLLLLWAGMVVIV